ncbi:OLC1v1026693C1 [Oldenlandia corymbosa var. corymbosa]|uniref:OLC1v1026693C1 n=1 Tax=Oldenlandia corymbosa var. corymbosa TaxID=529605 RepID=A0AAV1C7Y5_OLDCO|nr:OLC1v1026693C1 [Oldenlandia corymbosa var. corymbosa]
MQENSMAKYIVQQYIAAAGGDAALSSIQSMYAMGKVKMATTEVVSGDALNLSSNNNNNNNKEMKVKSMKNGTGEMGGFVLWQKRPELWNLELVVSGYKISAGSDGKVAWRQTPWHHSHASRGPPRPLRRSLQGLDPRSTANLFSNSICTGEKTVNDEDCFVLKLEVDPSILKARSSNNVEIIRHTLWGYFSQRTGLLVHLEDTHLLRIKAPGNEVFWETTMETQIRDYRPVDGVNIAHSGRTSVSLFRFGENSESHTRTRMEEIWTIEEIDFNIKGLTMDLFLPPADLKKEDEGSAIVTNNNFGRNAKSPFRVRPNASSRVNATKGVAKVMAIDEDDDLEVIEDHDL